MIAACGPLQQSTSAGSWANRWGPAFDRLHLLMAYASTSYDNRREGSTLASYLTRQSPLDVRRAWVQTATDIQSSDVTYAVMGVALSGWAIGCAAAVLVAKSPCGFRAVYAGRAERIVSVRSPGKLKTSSTRPSAAPVPSAISR